MYRIRQTDIFLKWLKKLKDVKGKVSILRRIERTKDGNFGDHKPIGNMIYELRIVIGPGYRVYYTLKNNELVILLAGGDKSSQSSDIAKAKQLAKELQDE